MLVLRLRLKKILILLTTSVCFVLMLILVKNRSSILSPSIQEVKFERKIRVPLPGTYINKFKPSNKSFCNFNYDLPNQLNYKDSDLKFSPQLQEKSAYYVLYNVIESKLNFSKNFVTLSTHVTPHFVNFLAELIKYWDGPLSVAVFVPDFDANLVIDSIKKLCYCLPNMNKLSMHFVFPKNRLPIIDNENYGVINTCEIYDLKKVKTFRDREGLPYPVNICRNVARKAVKTTYSLVADVELIPSANMSTNFIKMLKSFRNLDRFRNYVFVIPVFEVEFNVNIPQSKSELKKLYDAEKAVYFHREVCSHCQKFPGLVKWLNRPTRAGIRPFTVARREIPYHRWEPIYIGTGSEPYYSETLSWEGQQDKMTQMLEMCLGGYRLVILDGCFLVHWPGIKKKTWTPSTGLKLKETHRQHNTKQYQVILDQLAAKYTENEKCGL